MVSRKGSILFPRYPQQSRKGPLRNTSLGNDSESMTVSLPDRPINSGLIISLDFKITLYVLGAILFTHKHDPINSSLFNLHNNFIK